MTLYDLVIAALGITAVVGAIIAARKMTPEHVRYLDRVAFTKMDQEPPRGEVSITGAGEELYFGSWADDLLRQLREPIHVISSGDPIEFLHPHKKATIHQIATERVEQQPIVYTVSERGIEIKKTKLAAFGVYRRLDDLERRMRGLEEQSQRTWEEKAGEYSQHLTRTRSIN